jgi:hypothetical protein
LKLGPKSKAEQRETTASFKKKRICCENCERKGKWKPWKPLQNHRAIESHAATHIHTRITGMHWQLDEVMWGTLNLKPFTWRFAKNIRVLRPRNVPEPSEIGGFPI